MSESSSQTLASSLDKLQLSTSSKALPKAKKPEPVDSWEDAVEQDDTGMDVEKGSAKSIRHITTSDYPSPPPPTPASPSFSSGNPLAMPYKTLPPFALDGALDAQGRGSERSPARRDGVDDRRPDKSTAVACRLIAAGIGQKAPRRTKEQREYDQAMKMQERKRREQLRADEEAKRLEKEKAKRAIWDD